MSTVTATSWKPTRKWIGTAVTGAASIVATWIVSGAFDGTEKGMLATLVTALAAGYFVSNDATPGGVPTS